jgi:hypothetical protein
MTEATSPVEETAVNTLPNTTRASLAAAARVRSLPAVDWRAIVAAGALFALFSGLLFYIQAGAAGLAGTDGYYHAKMGLLMRQQGLTPAFVWLPHTILNEASFYDHHLLYHLYLSLFAAVDPAADGGVALTQGAKWASVIMPALAFTAIWWLLRGRRVPWAAVWAVGLFAVSEAFLYRMSMPRAQAASLLVLALGLHALFAGRFRLLLPLGFVYVWLYNAFPLLLVVSGVYVAALFVTERRLVWRALAFPAAGIALGLILNPYFPEDITFVVNHLLPKIGDSSTQVGNEWYPYETWTLVENSGFALVAFALGVIAWAWRKDRIGPAALTILVLTFIFGFMLFRSRRFIEYFPAFALIFAAVSAGPLLAGWVESRPRLGRWLPAGMLLALALPLAITVPDARASIATSKPADQYAAAASWLGERAAPGSLVFQTDWDDFPRLFFYNTSNVYTIGLDPTYMELHDEALFDEWVNITRGRVGDPGAIIRDRFSASYVFSDLDHEAFIAEAANDPLLTEIYRDEYAVIFAVST